MSARLGSLQVNRALVFIPHHDDAEIVAGGTIAKWVADGVDVALCVVTNGACGSNDPAVPRDELIVTRRAEQRRSAEILGIGEVVFLAYEDGFLEDGRQLRLDLTREIRRLRPDVVLGPDPATYYLGQWYVNHPDHRALGLAVLAAVNPGASTVPWCREELYDRGFKPHSVGACLLMAPQQADLYVDIDEFIDAKVAALSAHESQAPGLVNAGLAAKGVSVMMARDSDLDCRFAEGFKAIFPGYPEGIEELLDE
ncbi:MAG: PIG-L deacetylase family protein [Actinomycetota bacterium]